MASDSTQSTIPPLEHTALHEIPAKVDQLRATFRTGLTKDIQFRLVQLRKLYWGIVDNTPLMEEALMRDLRKCKFESTLSEIDWCKRECMDMINNIEKWAKDEPVVNVPLEFKVMGHRIRNEPLGVILAIGSYNYPFQLNLTPLIGAIAAGNCVVLKASEASPYSAMVLKKLFDECLDPECYTYVNGAVPETQLLLEQKFDKIAFTGGKGIGKIVARKAAETLTPVLLELGGQNPAFVTKNANIKMAARRLLWQKVLNAGQVCVSHNYILVERSVLSQFLGELNGQLRVFMPKGARNSPDFARLVNKRHFDRVKKMLDSSMGKIVLGGSMDESDLFIEPTAVLVDDIQDSMMVEESFGPIFSVMAFDTLDQAIDIANNVDPTPLALFTFGTDAESKKVLDSVTSGGATINDSFFHNQIPQAPMGGIGQSGTGSYHGYYSFKAFSHQRTIAKPPYWADSFLRVRYMPYSWPHLKRLHLMNGVSPNFDRNGVQLKGLKYYLGLIFSLGGKSSKRALIRWAVFAVIAAVLGAKNGSLNQWLAK
ncbi:Aldehyde/histidinol dehydrogenase [Ilyonectria robusta]|uniref:Aldehyde/histidinol dehydrogenase n=1 Tax=Ilyonectria robusta TaxID=1079257 RepID=UPI001E8DBF7E|nr:Aldehyde/histidinol dehydrogenase [Ilyonectria robusta]KAH8699758.1 Aldehyde/histidinol dehydrogenase [Ilyonectria robusta]